MNAVGADEYGFLAGETLSDRLRRVDAERSKCRVDVGVRDEPQSTSAALRRERQGGLVLDEQLCPLALDLLGRVHAMLASSTAGIPYSAAREATRFSGDEQAELAGAVEQLVIKHSAAFAEHKEIVELGVAFMAIRAAQLNEFLCLTTAADQPLTWKQSALGLLMILAPLVIPLAIYLLNLLVTKLRG